MILDYSTYIHETKEFSRIGKLGNVEVSVHVEPSNKLLFDVSRGFCSLCKKPAKSVYSKSKSFVDGRDFWWHIEIWECQNCGWWECEDHYLDEDDLIDSVNSYHTVKLYHSIVKTFDIDSKHIPTNTLVNELKKDTNLTFKINPHKFEQVAKHVFSAYYNCDVKHVGRSHDGGIDLYIIDSDDPILVQVKRRESSTAVESISTVRDFLGAMFINNSRRGIILSTAKRFSRISQQTADTLIANNRLDLFELHDFNSFCSMLDVIKKDTDCSWSFLCNIVGLS